MIKISFVLCSILLFVSSLGARMNPFETTQAYIDTKLTLVEALKTKDEVLKIPTPKVQIIKFVDISIIDNIMNLSAEYKLKRWFILENEKKIVFDYISKKRFLTKIEPVSTHLDFDNVTIGAHPEKNYLRIVIQTKYKTSQYKISFREEGLITIFRK